MPASKRSTTTAASTKGKGKAKAPVQPVQPTPPPAPVPEPEPEPEVTTLSSDKSVVYDKLSITEYSTASAKGSLTVDRMKLLLGWETEPEFQARKVGEFPDTKPSAWVFGDDFHCKNLAGEKVRCHNNAGNRAFDMGWCESLIHTVLYGQWAGPHTVPGETVNGETVRISRYGEVLSGQHQMTAGILADGFLQRDRELLGREEADRKYPAWAAQDHVFLETIVITGMSSDPRILMTVDYVKPRTTADVFYTSQVFRDATPNQRRELCRLLAGAVDLLWTRTAARGYRTHPEVVAFLERHPRLLKCVLHIFAENSEEAKRRISKLRLSPGHCAALMYLMACSGPGTDGDEYRNEEPAPSEKRLDWSLWNKAEEFWTLLAAGAEFLVVRKALALLMESSVDDAENQGQGGRAGEKLALIRKAWDRWRDHSGRGPVFDESDLEVGGYFELAYCNLDDRGNKLPDGQLKLLDDSDLGGIDCPTSSDRPRRGADAPDPKIEYTEEEMEKAREAAQRRREKK